MAKILVADDEEGIRTFVAETQEMAGHDVPTAPDGLAAAERMDKGVFRSVDHRPQDAGARWSQAIEANAQRAAGGRGGCAYRPWERRYGGGGHKAGGVRLYSKSQWGAWPSSAWWPNARWNGGRCSTSNTRPSARLRCGPSRGGAAAMKPVVDALQKVAATSATVLLQGESGTGKEVAARAVHGWSARAEGPFVAVNCAALSDALLESELFGHEKGGVHRCSRPSPGPFGARSGGHVLSGRSRRAEA